MKIHHDAQYRIDYLNKYEWDETEKEFDILHLYPKDPAANTNSGYVDASLFELIGYNTNKMVRRNLGRHDGLSFGKRVGGDTPPIDMIRIYADGSTMIRFSRLVHGNWHFSDVDFR